ncbi:uncharacterized protein LOC134251345 [Saccostrea cucullata]|uniref:uncharacterized protein LOC134251345 n=1 Tax=Saccostrea cuccullata TaxID=36930 RepID=UPI002ED500FE
MMDYEKVLDFSDTGETKLQILKFSYNWIDEVERQEQQQAMELEEAERTRNIKCIIKQVHGELIDVISRKTRVTDNVNEDMVRKREMMAAVHAELMTLEKKKAENFIKNYIGNIILAANEKLLNETSREYVHRVIVLAISKLKKEIQKSTRVSSKVVAEQIQPETDTNLEDSKPRKIVDTNDYFD